MLRENNSAMGRSSPYKKIKSPASTGSARALSSRDAAHREAFTSWWPGRLPPYSRPFRCWPPFGCTRFPSSSDTSAEKRMQTTTSTLLTGACLLRAIEPVSLTGVAGQALPDWPVRWCTPYKRCTFYCTKQRKPIFRFECWSPSVGKHLQASLVKTSVSFSRSFPTLHSLDCSATTWASTTIRSESPGKWRCSSGWPSSPPGVTFKRSSSCSSTTSRWFVTVNTMARLIRICWRQLAISMQSWRSMPSSWMLAWRLPTLPSRTLTTRDEFEMIRVKCASFVASSDAKMVLSWSQVFHSCCSIWENFPATLSGASRGT